MGNEKNQTLVAPGKPANKCKVLYVVSELYPLIKTGGLGDVAGSLPKALVKLNCDIKVLMPCYAKLRSKIHKIKTLAKITIDKKSISIIEATITGTQLKCCLIEYAPYFDRVGTPYIDIHGNPWPDNALRFDLLCKVAARMACNQINISWKADVVHCNDWQTGLVPLYLQQYQSPPASIFTIHNLAYQGLFSKQTFNQLKLDNSLWNPEAIEFYGQMSFIKAGIVLADKITTVSPNYANEIKTSKFGQGLDGLLRHRQTDLVGILNGIDTKVWDPWKDPYIYLNYNINSLDIKHTNKLTVQTMFNLDKNKNKFVIGLVSRIVEQKGFTNIIAAVKKLIKHDIHIVILGCGDPHYEKNLLNLAKKFPRTLSVKIGYSENIAHMIIAGADAFLMPSNFEPCGLSQMYSLRYGTIPIVREVGGLADTVVDYNNKNINTATGIIVDEDNNEDLAQAIIRCHKLYLNKKVWKKLQINAMRKDYSWKSSSSQYLNLYIQAVKSHIQPLDAVI